MVQAISTGTFCEAKWVVDPVVSQGTHTTIQAAINAASSGDTVFIRANSSAYTENITLKAGVNLTGFGCDGLDAFGSSSGTPNVIILGTVSSSISGTCGLSGLRLRTNGAAALATSGASTGRIIFSNCSIVADASTGITLNAASCVVAFYSCSFFCVGATALFASTTGQMNFSGCQFSHDGTSTASSTANSTISFIGCNIASLPITTSSTGNVTINSCSWQYGGTTLLTTAGTGSSLITNSYLSSTTASAISAGAGTSVTISNCTISSSNTNAVTGAGTVIYGTIDFPSTSNTINTTTQTALVSRRGISVSSLQPAFLATAASQLNVTGNNATYTLQFTTEVFDQNGNFDGTSTFTAPITGRYVLFASVSVVDPNLSTGSVQGFVTSNRTYQLVNFNPTSYGRTTSTCQICFSTLCDMDSGDTATCFVNMSGAGANTVDISATTTQFAGYLEC